MYAPAWPHSQIKEVFPNIFFVTGTNKTTHDNIELQHSRNMIIIRHDSSLSLINSVRLNDEGLASLEALGRVENIIRIGAFHGRDDAFYLDRYDATLWALKGMQSTAHRHTEVELVTNGKMPFPECTLFVFETSQYPEGILHIAQEGGILITCDSIKNWVEADQYFSDKTARIYQDQGFFGTASISNVWKQACLVKASDFIRLQTLTYQHLLSAHGEPLMNKAYESIAKTISQEFNIKYGI